MEGANSVDAEMNDRLSARVQAGSGPDPPGEVEAIGDTSGGRFGAGHCGQEAAHRTGNHDQSRQADRHEDKCQDHRQGGVETPQVR
jgi:hypothetical protein